MPEQIEEPGGNVNPTDVPAPEIAEFSATLQINVDDDSVKLKVDELPFPAPRMTVHNELSGRSSAVKARLVSEFGGTAASERAVNLGLKWLADHDTFQAYIGDPNTNVPGIYAWIGLFAPTETSGFQWVTGESVSYTNGAPPEPNFFVRRCGNTHTFGNDGSPVAISTRTVS